MGEWKPISEAPRDGTPIMLGWTGNQSYPGMWISDVLKNHWGRTGWFMLDDDVLTGRPSNPDIWQPFPEVPHPLGKGGS